VSIAERAKDGPARVACPGGVPASLPRLFHLWKGGLSPRVISVIQAIFLPTPFIGGLFPTGLATARITRKQAGASVGRLYGGRAWAPSRAGSC